MFSIVRQLAGLMKCRYIIMFNALNSSINLYDERVNDIFLKLLIMYMNMSRKKTY